MSNAWAQKHTGFTIVELLIVIVVIAILAAITVVAYTGVSARANDTAVQSDLNQFAKKMGIYYAENGRYPDLSGGDTVTDPRLVDGGVSIRVSKGSYMVAPAVIRNFALCGTPTGDHYIVAAMSKSGTIYSVSDSSGVAPLSLAWGAGNSASQVCAAIGSPFGNNGYLIGGYVSSNRTPAWANFLGGD